jgi:hypothetical protein
MMCKAVHVALDLREVERSEELDRRIAAIRREDVKRVRRVRKPRRGTTAR